MNITQVIETFPPDLHSPVRGLCEWIREERGVIREDFSELKALVGELASAQLRTESRVEELAQAQQRTETRVEELAQAQQRTEARVEELAQAQQRTEARVEELADTQRRMSDDMLRMSDDMLRMSEDMRRMSDDMRQGFKELRDSVSALGSRWGIMTEATFRATIEGILSRTGYTVTRGYYGSREVDVVIRNGEHMLLEICSVLKKSDIPKLLASGADYVAREGVRPRLLIAATRVPPKAREKLAAAEREIGLFSWDEEDE